MRLVQLELLAYGHFRGLALDFGPPGLHVVLGRNEAGKSTTLRAITGLLYGIDRSTPDAHVHKMNDLRIGGVLEGPGGERLRVVRRKGNTNTLLDERGGIVDEAAVKRLLGGVPQETFRTAFGLDHDTLEAGAKALLEGKGDLGESLFDASVGGGGEVQRLLAELAEEADAIYKPRASSLPLNDAMKSFGDAQRRVRERQSLPEAFLEQERGLEEAIADRAAQVAEKAALVARKSRLDRGRRRYPLERRRERALEQRSALGSVSADVARIDALKDRFGAYERALEQRRGHLAEAERLADRVDAAAVRAGIDPAAGLGSIRLEGRQEGRIHSLLRERTTLTERREQASVDLARLDRDLARLAEVAAPDGGGGDAGAVEHALAASFERGRLLGDIESRLAAERAKLERREADLARRASAMGLDGPLASVVTLRLPSRESLQRLEVRAADAARTRAQIADRLADLERENAVLERQLAGQTGDFAPPDVAALTTARAARDEAWRVLRGAPDGDPRRAAEVDLERLLRAADDIADRMIREADRVTSLARLRSEAETNGRQREKLAVARQTADDVVAALRAEHEGLFEGTGVRALEIGDTGGWLERHRALVADHAALATAGAELGDEEARVTSARDELVAALDAAFDGKDVTVRRDARLADVVAVAGRRLAAMEARRREVAEATRAIADLRAKRDDRIALRARDEAALADAAAKLGAVVSPFGIPAEAPAEEVTRGIAALRDLFGLVDARANEEARARTAEAEVLAFEADLARVVAELAPDLAPRDPRDAAPLLFARGGAARDNAVELASVDEQLAREGEVVLDDTERALVADPDAAAAADLDLAERIEELDLRASRATERIGALRKGLEEIRSDSHAAQAAAEAQEALARVREQAERYARVRLAAVLLSREIERYREENQGPVLAAASSLFGRLTLGAFAGIKAGFDEKDRPCLRCVRAGAATEVDVAGLSDGTRDALYLSLRLASLLRRAELSDPMPLILDDVLIQLDDARAAAALAVLAEVSVTMQVLFFTHHARLVELARATVPGARLVVHELVGAALPSNAPLGAPG